LQTRELLSGVLILASLSFACRDESGDGTPEPSPPAGKPFVLPLRVGTTWEFLFGKGFAGEHGIHTWRVLSSDGNGTWSCMDTRRDTLGTVIPTTNDSITFLIRDLPDYYLLEFPEFQAVNPLAQRIPKRIDIASDTVAYVKVSSSGVGNIERAIYVNGIGLTHYDGRKGGMSAEVYALELIRYWIP
jgi:hypothetical protein